MQARLAEGQRREKDTIEILNSLCPIMTITSFTPANEKEDIVDKIDCWAKDEDGVLSSVQIKTRENDGDFGLALIRPYENHFFFGQKFFKGEINFDRDLLNAPDYYVCNILSDKKIMIIRGHLVHTYCLGLLHEFASDEWGFVEKTWPFEGGELKQVIDQGAGYTHRQGKIIAYFSPEWVSNYGLVLSY